MSNQLKEFAHQYYAACQGRNLNLNPNKKLPVGEFDRHTLGVNFSGIDEDHVNKMKKALSDIEKLYNSKDIFSKHDVSNLINKNPDLISLVILQELQFHEYFHLLQTLLLPSCYQLYKASREMATLKVMIFGWYLKKGGKFSLDKNLSVFEYLDFIKDNDVQEYLRSLFELYRGNTSIVKNFFSYTENNTHVNMVDLMEGSAYFFQKIASRSISINTFTPKKDSPYLIAHQYFKKNGGQEDLLFIILCHISLKYGVLDDGDFMELMPTPQDIFQSLCSKIENYNKYLSNIPRTLTPLTRKFTLDMSETYSPLEKLQKWGFSIEEQDCCFNNEMNSQTDEELYATGKIMELCKIIESDVQKYFAKAGVKFRKSLVEPEEVRASSIKEKLKYDYKNIESYLFLSLLLTNYVFSVTMLNKYLPQIKNVQYKGLFSEKTNTLMDDNLYRIVNDIDSLIINGVAPCCQEHGKLPFRKLIICENKAGLNNRVKSLAGVDLREILE